MEDSYAKILMDVLSCEDIRAAPRGLFEALLAHLSIKYRFVEPICLTQQSLLLKAERKATKEFVVVKLALPDIWQKTGWFKKVNIRKEVAKHKELTQKHKYDERHFEIGLNKEVGSRFARSISIQRQLHAISVKNGLTQYGYIPSVLEVGTDPKKPFYVMEFIEAEDFLKWCAKHDREERLNLFIKIVHLIEKGLHVFSIIHSDIKPGNFLVAGGGLPVLLDFGSSKKLAAQGEVEAKVTDPATSIASKYYASNNEKKYWPSRSYTVDIERLGVLLWIMTINTEPEVVDENRKIHEVFSPDMLPRELRGIYYKCTCENADIYKDISMLREDMEKALRETVPRVDERKGTEKSTIPVVYNWDWEYIESIIQESSYKEELRSVYKVMEIICKLK